MLRDIAEWVDAPTMQRVLDAVPLLVVSCDRDGRYLHVNRAYAERWGRTPAELVGRTMRETVGSQVYAAIEPLIRRVLDGERVETEATVNYPNLGPQTFRSVLTPITDLSGRVAGWDGVGENVTHTRRAESELRNFAFLVQNTTDFVGMADLQFRPFFVNPAGIQLTGVTKPIAELSLFDFIAEEHHAFLRDTFFPQVLMHGRASAEVKFRNMRTNDTFWMDYNVLRIVDADGAATGYATISRSLVERKQAEEKLRAADRKKDEFLGILAHELRNMLGPMTFAVASVERHVDESARKPLDLLARQIGRMSRLVDDLLDVSRIAEGKIELRHDVIDMGTVVRASVDAVMPAVKQHRHRVDAAIADGVLVVADAPRMAQVCDNLLGNAVKYTPDGGRLTVSLSREGSEAVLRIRDTGIGIAADVLPRIFEMFVQSERSLERAEGGLGIGLTLVERLVRLHGGSVAAFSDGANEGSEFVVRLPLAR